MNGLRGRITVLDFATVALQLVLVLVLLRQFQIESSAFRLLAMLAFAGFAIHAFLPLPGAPAVLHRLEPRLHSGGARHRQQRVAGRRSVWRWSRSAICRCRFACAGSCCWPLGALLIAQRATAAAGAMVRGDLADPRLDVHVPADRLLLRSAPRQGSGHGGAIVQLFLHAAERVLSAVPGHRLQDLPAQPLQRRRLPHLSEGRRLDPPRHRAPHPLPVHLLPRDAGAVGSHRSGEFLQYLVSNFLLYLRVSGLFHMVVGMLHLFGFHLPETHHRYLLAASFTDFWRRINIYWKDFMQKIFYFPLVFALKRLGTNNAIIVATMFVFVLTWLLHSYQWFWLRGTWLLAWHDMLFWAVLGVLVVANSLYEIKYGRKRSLGKSTSTWQQSARHHRQDLCDVLVHLHPLVVLDQRVDRRRLALWTALKGPYTAEALLFPVLSLIVIALGSITDPGAQAGAVPGNAPRAWGRERAITVASLLALVLISIEGVHTRVGPEFATMVHSLRSAHLSRLDNAKLERGYYEGLLSVDRFNSQLWEVYAKKPSNWLDVESAGLKRFVGGFAQTDLIPSFVLTTKYGTVTINRWGMRDQDYAQEPPAGTLAGRVLGRVVGHGLGRGRRRDVRGVAREPPQQGTVERRDQACRDSELRRSRAISRRRNSWLSTGRWAFSPTLSCSSPRGARSAVPPPTWPRSCTRAWRFRTRIWPRLSRNPVRNRGWRRRRR